jgi:transposase
MWIFRGGDPHCPTVIFSYHPSRSGDVAHTFLRGYQGAVQTDGYSGYNFLDVQKEVIHIGCWAHARRKFMEADKARPKKGKPGSTTVALNAIQTLYRVEKKAKKQGLSGQDLLALRRKESLPVLQEFRTWLEKRSLTVTPQSLLGKAVGYTLKQWSRLVAYVEVAAATPDNNLAENAIRPFVVGRKNWLFAGTPQGAQASAAIYSLIETAKANGLDVYRYLRLLFDNLPMAKCTEDYRKLLPNVVSEEQMPRFSNFSVV